MMHSRFDSCTTCKHTMKEYLPIIERLFYAIAFFVFGWFVSKAYQVPCYVKNDVEVIKDTVFIKEKTINNTFNKTITRIDSLKETVNYIYKDSIKVIYKDSIIVLQDTLISVLKTDLDTCYKDYNNCLDNTILINKKHKRRIKIMSVVSAVAGGVLVGIIKNN